MKRMNRCLVMRGLGASPHGKGYLLTTGGTLFLLTFPNPFPTVRAMAYLSSSTRARILSQIETKEAQLEAANAAYTESLTDANVQSYKFESGDGSQSSVRRRPAEILSQIRQLEQQIERLQRRLDGTGIVSLNLRRNY